MKLDYPAHPYRSALRCYLISDERTAKQLSLILNSVTGGLGNSSIQGTVGTPNRLVHLLSVKSHLIQCTLYVTVMSVLLLLSDIGIYQFAKEVKPCELCFVS